MKVLFIGGTGNISSPVSKLALEKGVDLYHLNRGNRHSVEGVKTLVADINNKEHTKKLLAPRLLKPIILPKRTHSPPDNKAKNTKQENKQKRCEHCSSSYFTIFC